MKALAVALGLAWLAASPAAAFNRELYRDSSNGKWYPVRWGPGTRTIRFQLNDRPLQLLPNLASDISLVPTIQAAMQAWAFAPISMQLEKMTATTSWALDGVNLITFADTPRNRQVVTGNDLGATLRWWVRPSNQSYWRITEVDILLDARVKLAADGRPGVYDLPGIMTHEFGHALGLSHSPVASAVMWTYQSEGETRARTIDPDDVNAVSALYGDPNDAQKGTIAGRVLTGTDAPVFGAHVVATDSAGIVRGSAFTEKDGSFELPFLPPGSYLVFVEPINKVHATGEFSYDYYHNARRDFRGTFVGGNQPRSIPVSAGDTVALDPIHVDTQPSHVNIQYIGGSVDGTDFSNVNAHALTIARGSFTNLLLLGEGLSDQARIQASGADITFDTNNISTLPWSNGMTGYYVPMSVRAGATPGGRNVYLYQDGEVAAYIGGIKVTGP